MEKTVPPANRSGRRPFQEDSPVINDKLMKSLYDEVKDVCGDKGGIPDLLESLFNQKKLKVW